MWKRMAAVLIPVGTVALVVAACGGGEATATPAPTATTVARPSPVATGTPSPATPAPSATPTSPAPTAAPTPTAPQPKTGGVLQARFYTDYRRWDTWRADAGFSYPFLRAMMSNLIQYQQGTFTIVGDLAESWDVGPDGKSYTFRLRRDAQWHDGMPVTSKDILYTFKRGQDPQYTFNKTRVDPIQTMETPDDRTFKVTLKDFSNAFLPQAATPFMLMYPAHVPDMAQWDKARIGSGPFKLSADRPSASYEFVRNPAYFMKDPQGRSLPYLDGIVFNVIPDPALALSAFLTGRVQCSCTISEFYVIQNEDRIRSQVPGVKMFSHLGAGNYLYFNTRRPPFDNLAFRQAIAIGVDKEKIGATFALGKTLRPIPALVPSERGGQWALPQAELVRTPGFNPDHSADLKIMRDKIQQSGVDPKKVKVQVLTSLSYQSLAEVIASHLASDLGLDTSVTVTQSTAEQNKYLQAGDFSIYTMSDNGVIDDPGDWYRDWITTGGAQNTGGYSNPRVDQILAIQDKEPDFAKRKQLILELQRIELTEFPKAPLLWQLSIRAMWPEVMDFKVGPLNLQNWDWSSIWLDKR